MLNPKVNLPLIITLFLLIAFLPAQAQIATDGKDKPKVVVDKRVELISIVFCLAGNEEYGRNVYGNYISDITSYFGKYRNHPLIEFAKKLADSAGIGYDAPLAMAFYIEQPPSLKPTIAFNDSIPEERWKAKNAYKFITLLQKFYIDADCEKFFRQEDSIYIKAENRCNLIAEKQDSKWYKEYHKVPERKFNIIVGLALGGNDYAPHYIDKDGREHDYAIISSWLHDSPLQKNH